MSFPSIPPLAGICSPEDARRPGLSVAQVVARLRRFAFLKQRLALLAAARLPAAPEWEVKSALALHAWYDSDHARLLRQRLLELREPPARLEELPDPRLESLMDEALASADTLELLIAVYQVLRPAVLAAVERYLRETQPLADHASCRVLRLVAADEREALDWGRAALAALSASPESRRRGELWAAHLDGYLVAAGGADGCLPVPSAQPPAPRRRAAAASAVDVFPRRDARFRGLFDTSTPADVVYLDSSRPAEERNLALLFKRLREMDVPEVIAGILAQTPGRDWSYYADMFRQMWDEARHALLGEASLASRGIPWHALPVNVTFSYKLARFCSPTERHILLYAIEQSLMPARRGKKYEWEIARQAADPLSTTFQDFDWADEVLHVALARRQLRPHLKGGLGEARRRADRLWKRIERGLERDPLPASPEDVPPADWWEAFARNVLGREPAPVPQTHVKGWRPLSA